MILSAWALQYWLCNEPGSWECRPGPPTQIFTVEADCLRTARQVKLRGAAVAGVHCRLQGHRIHVSAAANQVPQPAPACPGDQVVWVNTHTHIYHFSGNRWFGTTRAGRYLCRKAADKEGDRPTKSD